MSTDTRPNSATFELREQDGELDEVVARDIAGFHLEQMNEAQWWMCLRFADGTEVHVNVGAKNPRAKGYASYWVERPDA